MSENITAEPVYGAAVIFGSPQLLVCTKTMRYRNKANINEEEVQISESVGVSLGNFVFVVEALKPASIDMEFCMSDQTVKSFDLLTSEPHESRNAAVNGGIKPFGPSFTRFICICDLK